MRRALILVVALLTGWLADPTHAQQLTVVWDPATDNAWTVPEYRVYKQIFGDQSIYSWATTDLQIVLPVAPGESGSVLLSSFGWRLDENLNVVWAEGPKSVAVGYAMPSGESPPPPPPPELCAPDGTGNGVDEDQDGQVDEGCAVPPPPPPPPPSGCTLEGGLLNGQLYPIGYRFEVSMAQKFVDGFLSARAAEGWAEWRTRQKVRNISRLFMECRGI